METNFTLSKPQRVPTRARRVLVALALLGPIVFALVGMPIGYSFDYNLAWYIQFEALLFAGALPRHLPDMWLGMGGLDFFFYGPLPFYATALIARPLCWSCEPGTVFALGMGLGFAAASVAFFAFARRFMGPVAAAAGAVAYSVLPYHLAIDWVWRQAAGELFAYIFIPIAALGLQRIMSGERGVAILAGGFGLTIASHLPSALLAAHVFAVVFLIWAFTRRRAPGLVARATVLATVGGMLGTGLAAAYWLPALTLLADVSPAALYLPHYDADRWLYGQSAESPEVRIQAGVAIAATCAVALAAAGAAARPRGYGSTLGIWLAGPILFSLFMMSILSQPIWENWIIAKVQFPFRLMVFVDLSGAIGAGLLVQAALAERKWRLVAAVLVVVLIGASLLLLTRGRFQAQPVAQAEVRLIGASEYVPPAIYAEADRRRVASGREWWDYFDMIESVAADIQASAPVASMRLESRRATVTFNPGTERFLVPIPYWPHWRARDADGSALRLSADPALGAILLARPDAAPVIGPVALWLSWHWSEKLGLGASLMSLLMFALFAVRQRRARRLRQSDILAGPPP